MKKCTLLITPLLLLVAVHANATNITEAEIPDSVIQGLKSDHPNARNIKATRQQHFGETYYEVQFKLHGKPHETLYDRFGKPFGHEEEVAELPNPTRSKLKQTFGDYKLENAVSLHHPDGRTEYEIDLRSGGVLWEVVTNERGDILVKEKL